MAESTVSLVDGAVITGGSSGLGREMAQSLIRAGKKVILVGRTEASLKSTAAEIHAAGYYVLDTGKTKTIPDVVKQILDSHPDVNCLINNAGVQRPLQFPNIGGHQDYGFDLARADEEIDINIRGPLHLCLAFLPHFTSLPGDKKGVIINVSSILGYLPSSIINPVYNGTKAWLHMFSMNLRSQYAKSGKIKVVEIAPPTVTTALHRDRVDPGDNSKEKNKAAMSVEDFVKVVEEGWRLGQDVIAPGPAGVVVDAWNAALGVKYDEMTK